MLEEDLLALCSRCEARVVDVDHGHLELHFCIVLAVWQDACPGFEGHVLHRFFRLVEELCLELQSPRHVSLYLMAGRYTCGRLLFGCRRRRRLAIFLALLDSSLLACLELFFRDGVGQCRVIWIRIRRQWEVRTVHIVVEVVVSHFILGAKASNVVRDICPGAQTVDLRAF